MNLKNIEGIVLKTTKFGDKHLIFNCYTPEGMVSFFQSNAYQNKKKISNKIFPLNILDIQYNYSPKKDLQTAKEINFHKKGLFIESNIFQSTISIFIVELLAQCLNKDVDEIIYNFIKQKIEELSILNNDYKNFIWKFMLELTKYLGFYPDSSNIVLKYFNLKEGYFDSSPDTNSLSEFQTQIWKKMFTEEILNKSERKELLQILIRYYSYHIHDFKPLDSVYILEQIFE